MVTNAELSARLGEDVDAIGLDPARLAGLRECDDETYRLRKDGKKAHPLTVHALGGRHIFPLDRHAEGSQHTLGAFSRPWK